MDERLGRAVASRFDLHYIGLLGVLVVAKQSGLIDAVKPLMKDLRTIAGFWIDQQLYNKILHTVSEQFLSKVAFMNINESRLL